MRTIKTSAQVEIRPSPEELADVFWSMDADEQAFFFNRLGESSRARLCFQLQYVTDSDCLDEAGRYAMQKIGEYSEPSK